MLPCRFRLFQGLLVGIGQHEMCHQSNLGFGALDGQRAHALVLVPFRAVALDIGLKAVQVAHDDRVHAVHGRRLHVAHVPEGRHGLLQGPEPHGQILKVVVFAVVVQHIMGQTVLHGVQRLPVAGVVSLNVRVLPPEKCLEYSAPAHADLQTSAADMVQHGELFDELYRVVQGQHADARPKAQVLGALGDRRQKHVLGRRQAVHRRGVVLGQVVGVVARLVQGLQLIQSQVVGLLEGLPRDRLNVVKNSELNRHLA